MSADVGGTLAALNGGARDYGRFTTTLDGGNRTVLRSFACSMAAPVPDTIDSFGRRVTATLWVERCRSLDGTIESRYWRADDVTWRAIQPVSGQVGPVQTERLSGD